MAGYRLSNEAKADLAGILTTSRERWGESGRHLGRTHGVKAPVHVIYYRQLRGWIVVHRVLHERMATTDHVR